MRYRALGRARYEAEADCRAAGNRCECVSASRTAHAAEPAAPARRRMLERCALGPRRRREHADSAAARVRRDIA